jgi:DNA polymerase III subunit alpha
VLGPDVNESDLRFTVNKKGEIRFGLAAVKGVGESAVESITGEMRRNGPYNSIFDFAKRVNLRAVNKRSFEALAMAGAFDSFKGVHRAQYFYKERPDEMTFIEKLIKHVGLLQSRQASMQGSLFGGSEEVIIADPDIPSCETWSKIEQLRYENEVVGFYLSGHPLDEYRIELDNFTNAKIENLKLNLDKLKGREVIIGGMVIKAAHRTSKNGKDFGTFTVEDYSESMSFNIFTETYLKFKHLLSEGMFLLIKGRVEKRFNSEESEYRISHMEMLSEVLGKYTSTIHVEIDIDDFNTEKAGVFIKAFNQHPGKCPVRIKVRDWEEGHDLDLRSKNHRVDPVEFIKWISETGKMKFTLNNKGVIAEE